MQAIIKLENISFEYSDNTKALNNINLEIFPREKIAILGSNGCGKSTLFLLLNGILVPQKGSFYVKGKKINFTKKELFELKKIMGIVFQEPDNQIFCSHIFDEIAFGPLNMGIDIENVKILVSDILKDLNLDNISSKATHFLSQGQKKKITLADVLIMNPEIIALDEPSASLDPKGTSDFLNILNREKFKKSAFLLSTHDMDFAWEWADKIILMDKGFIIAFDTCENIFGNSELIEKCNLKLPKIVEIFNWIKLSNPNLSDTPYPRNMNELKKYF